MEWESRELNVRKFDIRGLNGKGVSRGRKSCVRNQIVRTKKYLL